MLVVHATLLHFLVVVILSDTPPLALPTVKHRNVGASHIPAILCFCCTFLISPKSGVRLAPIPVVDFCFTSSV